MNSPASSSYKDGRVFLPSISSYSDVKTLQGLSTRHFIFLANLHSRNLLDGVLGEFLQKGKFCGGWYNSIPTIDVVRERANDNELQNLFKKANTNNTSPESITHHIISDAPMI